MSHTGTLSRRHCIAGLGLLSVAGFIRPALARSDVARASQLLMGTRVDLVAQGPKAQLAIDNALSEMARLQALMSRYRDDSEVAALQRAAGKHSVQVSPETMAVLQQAQSLSRASRGAFDITVGAYDGWSFAPGQVRLPSSEELRQQSHLVDHHWLELEPATGQARLMRAGMKLDLGGIAKLPILAAGMQVLKQHDLKGAMINGGGDVLTMGQLQGQDWRVGLRDPRAPEQMLGIVSLSDGVIASSGDYERTFVRNGQRYHHVLDPRTGKPTQDVRGVAMVASSIEAVNGLGAAVMVAGSQAGRQLLDSQAGVDSLIVAADSQFWMSGRMGHRLQLAVKA